MTSAPADLDDAREPDASALSPARRVLPWALFLLVLALVALGYAVALEAGDVITGVLVAAVAVLGAIGGLAVRDSRDRWVPKRRALGDGVRRLGRALWH